MKINPDDPWYPCPFEVRTPVAGQKGILQIAPGWHPGVTIRLKLAESAMKEIVRAYRSTVVHQAVVSNKAFTMADAMIEQANRDEGKADEHT